MLPEPIKVLLVEDNAADARVLREMLAEAEPTQYRLTHVQWLSEALERVREETYDVVLLDLGLPDSHGLDTLAVAQGQARGVPIVLLTGFNDEAVAIRAVQEGAQDYLLKGHVDSSSLLRSVRYAIERKRAEVALAEQAAASARAEELRRSRQRIVTAQEGVRRDIATHLHGRVQGKLLALNGRLQELLRGTSLSSETAQLLSGVVDDMDQVIQQEVSVLSRRLYPSILRMGLVPAIQSLGDQFETSVRMAMEMDDELKRRERADRNVIPEPVRLTAYRIVEEALNNVVKHAQASAVTVRLDLPSEGQLRLAVQDNGQGFDVEGASGGLGMTTMQDYAEAAGGRGVIHSTPGKGTEVTATLPFAEPGAGHPERA